MVNSENRTVSVIIRTIGNRMHDLNKAVFSVFACEYDSMEAVIVYQGSDDSVFQEITAIQKRYPELKYQFVRNPEKTDDQRAKNLNLGIQAATGRYICFLDDDDEMYPNHPKALTELMEKENSVWAISMCNKKFVSGNYTEKEVLFRSFTKFDYIDLFVDNFIPIHTYMIDRSRCDNDLLRFPEDFDVLEDYAFLLSFSLKHRNPSVFPQPTVGYIFKSDMSNSTVDAGMIAEGRVQQTEETRQKLEKWDNARKKIKRLKKELLKNDKQLGRFMRSRLLLKVNLVQNTVVSFVYKNLSGHPKLYNLARYFYRKMKRR